MPDIEDFLPAEPPMLPLPRGLLKRLEVGAGYYGDRDAAEEYAKTL